jgi:hypothetical protein
MAGYYKPLKSNRFWLGFWLGLILPFLIFLLYYLFRFNSISFSNFLQFLVRSGSLVNIMSLSVFPNLAPFMFFMRTNRDRSAQGILATTIIFAILVFVLKFTL